MSNQGLVVGPTKPCGHCFGKTLWADSDYPCVDCKETGHQGESWKGCKVCLDIEQWQAEDWRDDPE